MFLKIIFICFLLGFCFLLFLIYKVIKLLTFHLKVYSGFVIDEKVDKILLKSTLIGELQSFDKLKNGVDRVPTAVEKAMAIATDVLLQNHINPRDYNLFALIILCRNSLGLVSSDRGGDVNGKS